MLWNHSLVYLVSVHFLYQILMVFYDSVYLENISFQVICSSVIESLDGGVKCTCDRDVTGLQVCEGGIREVQRVFMKVGVSNINDFYRCHLKLYR